jgi:hypothetical protein
MSQDDAEEDKKDKKEWYHRPLAHVLLFFVLLGVGAGAGVWADEHLAVSVAWGLAIGLVLGAIGAVAASKYLDVPKPPPIGQRDNKEILEALKVYTDGKIQRYNLLFAVNGGAFAIVQLLTDPSKAQILKDPSRIILGQLTVTNLALGMIVFTVLMTTDIWMWGQLMRREKFGAKVTFTLIGRAILLSIAGLIISGWVLAARM